MNLLQLIEQFSDYLVFIGLPIGFVLMIFGTIFRRGRFGINLSTKPIHCENCQEVLSKIRAPKSLSETLFGGCTCPKCGKKVDKWGKLID